MSDAIRGQQRSSEAIRGDQRRSEAIRGHQRPSEAIRFGARPAPIADDHLVHSQSVAISRHQSPSVAINAPIADDHVVAHGGVGVTDAPDEGAHQRPLEVIRVHQVGVTDARSLGLARREGDWAGSALVGHLHKNVHAFQIRSRRSKLGPLTKVLTGTQCGHRRRTGPSISSNRHQSPSVAISRHQSPSVAISRHQRTGPSISSDQSFAGRLAQPCTPSLVISRPSASTLRAAPRPTCGEGMGGAVLSTCMRHRHSPPRHVPPPTWHSVAISRNQPSSAVISRPTSHVAFGGKLKH